MQLRMREMPARVYVLNFIKDVIDGLRCCDVLNFFKDFSSCRKASAIRLNRSL